MTARRPAGRRGERGFTLIEMLVSLAVLGCAATMLLAGIGTAGILAGRQRLATAGLDGIAAAQTLLRDRIEHLRAVTAIQSADTIVDVRGTATSFDFVADPVDAAGPDALQHFRLLRTPAGDVVLFGLSSLDRVVDPRDPRTVGWTALPLIPGTAALSLSYYGTTLTGSARAWQTAWFDRRQPPDLVRVSVAFPAGDRRQWPDLVIRPRATVNAACRIDPLTGRCAATA